MRYLMQMLQTLLKKHEMESFLFDRVKMHFPMCFYCTSDETLSLGSGYSPGGLTLLQMLRMLAKKLKKKKKQFFL